MDKIYVLIPAYKPDERLNILLSQLDASYTAIIVDDGCGSGFGAIFDKAQEQGAIVLTHEINRGKGAALKTGYAYLKDQPAGTVITADADGQHTADDISLLASAAARNPDSLILGVRDLSEMPFRSRFGNTITRIVFFMGTGLKISDTQTGLRAFPTSLLDKMLTAEGDRYEYEINVLLNLKNWKVTVVEVPIKTIYIDDNSSSHFNPIKDGFRVFSRIIKHCASSLSCATIDYLLFSLFSLFMPLELRYIAARAISACINYQLSRRIVFHGQPSAKSAIGYFALA
ncbi:MAG: glycosyltransferase family 2 protein, partial [Christensenella sp.]